jgi:hypothetical protein
MNIYRRIPYCSLNSQKNLFPYMKKQIAWFITLATAAKLAVAQEINTTSVQPVIQPEFPKIVWQPEDQLVPMGTNATFIVKAANADGYQWLRNGKPVTGRPTTASPSPTRASMTLDITRVRFSKAPKVCQPVMPL